MFTGLMYAICTYLIIGIITASFLHKELYDHVLEPNMTEYQYETTIFLLEQLEKEYYLKQDIELTFEEEQEVE